MMNNSTNPGRVSRRAIVFTTLLIALFLSYQLRGDSGRLSAETPAQFLPMDCDSLENALRTLDDTVFVMPSFAGAGDTVQIPFYITNDSFLGGFALLYRFDTALLEPVIDTTKIENCNGEICDTIIRLHIRTTQTARLDQSGIIARGPYSSDDVGIARLTAVPIVPNIDSIAPGRDTLCFQHFVVKANANLGCYAKFEFFTRQIWQLIPDSDPPDSFFAGCQFNEYAVLVEDFPIVVSPTLLTGIFRVGNTAEIACGDANADGTINITDATFLIAYIFTGGVTPCLIGGLSDVNCSGSTNISDATFLISYIFTGGTAPCCPPGIP